VPSKLDGTVFDGSSVTIRLAPWTATVTRPAVDLNGDGIGDVVRYHETEGYVGWIYDAAGTVTEQRTLGGGNGWTLEVVGYFSGGPVSDLVWRETASGQAVLWIMNASAAPCQSESLA